MRDVRALHMKTAGDELISTFLDRTETRIPWAPWFMGAGRRVPVGLGCVVGAAGRRSCVGQGGAWAARMRAYGVTNWGDGRYSFRHAACECWRGARQGHVNYAHLCARGSFNREIVRAIRVGASRHCTYRYVRTVRAPTSDFRTFWCMGRGQEEVGGRRGSQGMAGGVRGRRVRKSARGVIRVVRQSLQRPRKGRSNARAGQSSVMLTRRESLSASDAGMYDSELYAPWWAAVAAPCAHSWRCAGEDVRAQYGTAAGRSQGSTSGGMVGSCIRTMCESYIWSEGQQRLAICGCMLRADQVLGQRRTGGRTLLGAGRAGTKGEGQRRGAVEQSSSPPNARSSTVEHGQNDVEQGAGSDDDVTFSVGTKPVARQKHGWKGVSASAVASNASSGCDAGDCCME